MARRKSAISKAQIDRDFPYQIAVPADRCTGANREKQMRFCADLSLAPRFHRVSRDGVAYKLFRFADPQHAQAFQAVFGGQKFSPATPERGAFWFRWR